MIRTPQANVPIVPIQNGTRGAKPLRRINGNSNRVGQSSQNVSTGLPSLAGRANNPSNGNGKSKFFPNVPYPQTAKYLRYLSNFPKTEQAIKSANSWIKLNRKGIDPSSGYICVTCGIDDMTLCTCNIPKESKPNTTCSFSDENRSRWEGSVYGRNKWWDPLSLVSSGHKFYMGEISRDCHNFDNSHMPSSLVDLDMYNFIKLNMSSRYSSIEDREEHVRKLCYKFLDTKKIDTTSLSTSEVNRILVTRQKVRDQCEIEALMQESRPREYGLIRKIGNFVWACFLTILNLLHFAAQLVLILGAVYFTAQFLERQLCSHGTLCVAWVQNWSL